VVERYHLPSPARAVGNLEQVIVSRVPELFPVKVSVHKCQLPSDLSVGSIGDVAQEISDLKPEIRVVVGGELFSGNRDGFL